MGRIILKPGVLSSCCQGIGSVGIIAHSIQSCLNQAEYIEVVLLNVLLDVQQLGCSSAFRGEQPPVAVLPTKITAWPCLYVAIRYMGRLCKVVAFSPRPNVRDLIGSGPEVEMVSKPRCILL